MTERDIQAIVEKQREWFYTGATLDVEERVRALKKLKAAIAVHEGEINAALKADLGKSAAESYLCEVGLTLSEIGYMLKHIRAFTRERTVRTPLAQFASRSYQKPSPYGVALIMSPWNYPFLLTMEPLVDALAYSPNTGAVVRKILERCFPPEYVAVITGGRAENTALLEQRFDYIFFTGSQAVGKEVMRRAAEHLTPVALELGGKSPCIVEKSADLKLAARRIVFGKFLNCGQTCVAPDYILCDPAVKDRLVREIKAQIVKQFGPRPLENLNYGRIVNEKHFRRLQGLIDRSKVVHGGAGNAETLRIEPTVLDDVTWDDAVMGEEIFGPILPVLTYDSIDEAIQMVNTRQHPLALYLFTSSRAAARKVMSRCGFGGGCVNDVVIHLATSEMGFGGFGESGMGAYHGRAGFDAFTHYKSIVDKKTWIDLPMRYQPYTKGKSRTVRFFLK